jgi:hypothetical protein
MFYFGQVCLVSWRLPVPEWANLSQDLGNFLLLFYWIYYESLKLVLLFQCPWVSGLVFWWSWWVPSLSFHRSWVVWLLLLTSILSSSSAILSSTCSSLQELPYLCVFCLTKGTFYLHDSCLILFLRFFHIFVQLLFYILCCLLYFISLLYTVLCFILVFMEDFSEFIYLFLFLLMLFICSVLKFLEYILCLLVNCV